MYNVHLQQSAKKLLYCSRSSEFASTLAPHFLDNTFTTKGFVLARLDFADDCVCEELC